MRISDKKNSNLFRNFYYHYNNDIDLHDLSNKKYSNLDQIGTTKYTFEKIVECTKQTN